MCLAYSLGISLGAIALTDDADQPIHISSKEAVWERVGTATYKGDVQVNQGSLEIMADKVTVEFEDERVVRVTALGEPARYQQKLADDEEPVRADANTIVYHTRDERIDLEGDAHLNQKGNEFRGEVIAYDVRAGRVNASTNEDKRIRMILQTKPLAKSGKEPLAKSGKEPSAKSGKEPLAKPGKEPSAKPSKEPSAKSTNP